jgi:hypothetical protein
LIVAYRTPSGILILCIYQKIFLAANIYQTQQR